MKPEYGVPSHDTFGRVFAALDPKVLEACFMHWMSGQCRALAGLVVAMDGARRCATRAGVASASCTWCRPTAAGWARCSAGAHGGQVQRDHGDPRA
ncbi:transposase family protein [Burkholderia multivorans]|uniref:transposase family protein n=1 Tax=Burkholderia multivorans TaxID=87883 RepID=UPI001E5B1384|nr:transposase family protein [Burkholderia multivorans]